MDNPSSPDPGNDVEAMTGKYLHVAAIIPAVLVALWLWCFTATPFQAYEFPAEYGDELRADQIRTTCLIAFTALSSTVGLAIAFCCAILSGRRTGLGHLAALLGNGAFSMLSLLGLSKLIP